MSVKATPTIEDKVLAHTVALERIAQIYGNPDDKSRYDKRLNFHEYVGQVAESIVAEILVARFLGFTSFDPRVSKFKETADVGSFIEVKWTKYDSGQLIVYENDRNTDVAILVTGTSPNYRLAGWIPIAMAKKPRYKHAKQPTWWVTQQNLQPIENLKGSNYGQASL
jgi:hypothetical protein